MTPEAADAMRDAMALARAHLARDDEGAAAVAAHLAEPAVTAALLARLFAATIRQTVPEPAAFLDAWQHSQGLL